MISVQRLPQISCDAIAVPSFATEMKGAPLVGDSRLAKHSSAGKLLDNETLLVILSTVLNTSTSTRTFSDVTSQSHTHQSQHDIDIAKACEKDSCELPTAKLQSLPRQSAPAELDFKIEKAMDTVKMELLSTVRKEVKKLKKQVAKLQTHNQHLEEENKILRSAAAPETLALLTRVTTSPPI